MMNATHQVLSAWAMSARWRRLTQLPSEKRRLPLLVEIFSYCLVDQASALTTSSPLIFGAAAAENSAATSYTPFLTNGNNPFYFVGVMGISDGGSDVQLDAASAFLIEGMGNGGVVLDSGTTLSMWTDVAFQAVSNAFQSQIAYPQAAVAQGFPSGLHCYDIPGGVGSIEPVISMMVVHMTNVNFGDSRVDSI